MDKDGKIKNAAVETYAGDMAEVIENDTGGLVKKIIHGAEESEAEKRNLSPESKKNKFFMFVSLILVFLALLTLTFFLFRNTNNTVPVEKQFTPIIFSDQSTYLEVSGLSKDQIAQTVLNEVNATKAPVGGVEGIYLTLNKQIIGLRRFINLIKSAFAPPANTLFVSDNFMMGVVNNGVGSDTETGAGFFILLKVRSTADIFDSLRAWETNLLTDLHGFLGINASSDTNYLFSKNFEDGIVENKNARMLYDQSGKLVLMYVFADDHSVVITDSQSSAQEVMLRLASGQTTQ